MVMKPRERIDYSAMADRAPLALPGGKRVAVWVIVNIENWDIERPMPRTVLPPPGHQVHIPDIPNWSWQEYGMRVGFWRFHEALVSRGVPVTMSVNGSVCVQYPRIAGAARDAGWEFLGHAYHQRPTHLIEDPREDIRRTIDTIRDFTGSAPRGWMGPGLTETFETPTTSRRPGSSMWRTSRWTTSPSTFAPSTAPSRPSRTRWSSTTSR